VDAVAGPHSYDRCMPPQSRNAESGSPGSSAWGGGPTWHAPWWDPEHEAKRFEHRSAASARLWLPVLISFFVQVPAVFFDWRLFGGTRLEHWDSPREAALHFLVAIVGPLALIAARRYPGPVVAIVGLAASADLLLAGDNDGPPYIALALAIGSAIVRGARIWAWATIAGCWIGTLVLAGTLGITWHPWRIVGISFGILVVVALAEAVRTRREGLREASRRVAARRQSEVQAERVRIARELHDVLAHSLSQINVQAGVGLHLIEKQPEKAAEALASIKETSKSALDEVRSVLGILRSDNGDGVPLLPEPDLSRLEGLAASVTAQGVVVELRNELGVAPKPTQLAIYRIVQESLTNVVRHAGATAATVALTESAGSYVIEVTDNGSAGVTTNDTGGRGLLGMRERAELLGGTLDAGPSDRGGFTVRATIPKTEVVA
jgi:signal transduction histidine kinase